MTRWYFFSREMSRNKESRGRTSMLFAMESGPGLFMDQKSNKLLSPDQDHYWACTGMKYLSVPISVTLDVPSASVASVPSWL